jgi:uncharacterized membrane protein YhaH (DUF805 family)
MGMGDAIRACITKYFVFSGRASRREYWWFFLFTVLVGFAAGIVDAALVGDAGSERSETEATGWIGSVWSLATLIPGLAVGWRRMHDSGRSGLHLLYPLIVMAGIGSFAAIVVGIPDGPVQDASIVVLVLAGLVFLVSPLLVIWWLTRPSDPEPNRYGPPPPEVRT